MAENIISIEDLSKSFGDHEVLRKIDISVDKGEVICIVGSSGSGKSTLLRCINRLEHQTSGRILYHGKEVRDVQREINRYRAKVGMVFQSFNLFNNMTVLENCMCCTRRVLHLSKKERQAGAALGRPEAESRHRPGALHESGGASLRRTYQRPGSGNGRRSPGSYERAGADRAYHDHRDP